MNAAIEIALIVVGLLGILWAATHPNANIVTRLIAVGFGILMLIAARALHHATDREEQR